MTLADIRLEADRDAEEIRRHDRYIERRVDYILLHANTQVLQEIVAEGLLDFVPEICRAAANGNDSVLGGIVRRALTKYAATLAEKDWWRNLDEEE